MTRSARLRSKVGQLMSVAQQLSSAPSATVKHLCDQILGLPEEQVDYCTNASCLNNDGVPLQLCLSADRQGTKLRLIGDPGVHIEDLESRYQSAQTSLDRCLDGSDLMALSPLVTSTLAQFIPDCPIARSHYHQGFMWLALSPDQPGMAFYLETSPLGKGVWETVRAWLVAVLPSVEIASGVIAKLQDHCVVVSVGLEGHDFDHCRAKVYFRLAESIALDQLGIDQLIQSEMMEFLQLAMGDFGVDREGLVMSIGFSVNRGDLIDVKIDLCGHCLAYTNSEWLDVIEGLTQRFGLKPLQLDDVLLHHSVEVAFIGLGLDRNLQPRLNVYLKATDPQGFPTQTEIVAAIADGVRYLCELQQENGAWVDYPQLPVGASDQWVTAYVGYALAQQGTQPAWAAAQRGGRWLSTERTYPAGWGYNAMTGPDADSTAMTLSLLRELDWPIAPEDQAFLRGCWRSAGGLATYDHGPGAWGDVHWDVTPIGYLGLTETDQQALRESFLKGLWHNRMEDGMWRAYWWRQPYYSTWLTLEVLIRLDLPEPNLPRHLPAQPIAVDNPFDLSCLIGIEFCRGKPLAQLGRYLRSLLSWQSQDGRWAGHPNLRVTDPTCHNPWERSQGEYYSDQAATITTATVLRVLTNLLPIM
jgi:hypothetical protein